MRVFRRMRILPTSISALLAGLCIALCTQQAAAFQGNETPPEFAVTYADDTIFDYTAPVPGVVTAPAAAKASPITVSYSETLDAGGSALKQVSLWVKEGATGTWTDTGLTSTTPSGSFSFSGLHGQGRYFFAIVAEDNAGNKSPEPTGDTSATTSFDSQPPVITLLGSTPVTLLQGQSYSDAGATAVDNIDGDVTSKISVTNNVVVATPGSYTVTYNLTDAAGNAATPVTRSVTVGATFGLTVTQPSQGSLSAAPGPNAGTRYSPNTDVTITYAADAGGKFEIDTWTGATAISGIPHQARVSMTSDKTVSATAKRLVGSVQIDVNPNNAAWIMTNGDGQQTTGAGDKTIAGIPTGSITVTFQALAGFKTPDAFSLTLTKGQTVKFTGTYTPSLGTTLTLPLNLAGKPGQTLDVPVAVTSATGITNYSAVVSFDSKVLDCTGVAAGSLTGGWAAPSRTIAAGSVSFAGSGTALGNTAGSIAVLKLRVKDTLKTTATSTLNFGSTSLNQGAIAITTENGSVTVKIGSFIWGDVDNSTVVDATDAAKILQFVVGVLPTLPSAADGTSGEVVGDVSGDKPSALGGVDAALIYQKIAGQRSTFPADTNSDSAGPETATTATTKSFADTLKESAGPVAREITMPGLVKLQAGATILVPVRIDNASKVMTYFLDLDYDSTFLEFANASKGDVTKNWPEPIVNSATPGQLSIVAAGAETLPAGAGELVMLSFRVKGAIASGQTSQLGIVSAALNDGLFECNAKTAQGTPVLTSIAPKRGSTAGGTVIVLNGSNLTDVDEVLFGANPATIVESSREATTLSVIAPAGSGVVDVTASSFGESAKLAQAFTYFAPDIQVDLDAAPEVNAGEQLQIPVTITNAGTPSALKLNFKVMFDPTMFTIPPNMQLIKGAAATKAGATVTGQLTKPGEYSVAVVGATPIPNGQVCIVTLLAIGNVNETEGVIFLRGLSASGAAGSKSLEADGGVAGEGEEEEAPAE